MGDISNVSHPSNGGSYNALSTDDLNFDIFDTASLESEVVDKIGKAVEADSKIKGEPTCWIKKGPEGSKEEFKGYFLKDVNPKKVIEAEKEKQIHYGNVGDLYVECDEVIESFLNKYGLKVHGKNRVLRRPVEKIITTRLSAKQLERINQAATRALSDLAKSLESQKEKSKQEDVTHATLNKRTFVYLKDRKPAIPLKKFPNLEKLRVEAERKRRAEQERQLDEHAKETRTAEKRRRTESEEKYEKRESAYKKKLENKQIIENNYNKLFIRNQNRKTNYLKKEIKVIRSGQIQR